MLPIQIAHAKPWWSRIGPTARYLMQTEAHVYALAMSASVLLAFYPFLIVMMGFCHNVLHWRAAEQAIYLALNDFFARGAGEFFARNLQPWMVGRLGLTSMFLLLFTANGIFEPLEVALNRAWGVAENRPYWKNQLVALGLILACGLLALLSLMFTALNEQWMSDWAGSHASIQVWLNLLFFKIAALPLSILALFLVYWLLPNRKIEPARVAPVAILVGLALEALKYVNLLIWPLLKAKLEREYNIFQYSVTILLWSFAASMIVLAGAEWTARHGREDPLS
ncbi:MAG TPA: YihY/virulence factor BrkB family protein [Bryobacteraceae bacterium]|nr:YihY/virulence factor BrkB family protein [Bryobacteraceae bacterium]